MDIADIKQAVNAKLDNEVLNALFRASWPSHAWLDFEPVLARSLVHVTAAEARSLGASWMHVDFVPELEPFCRAAGFRSTTAGLVDLRDG